MLVPDGVLRCALQSASSSEMHLAIVICHRSEAFVCSFIWNGRICGPEAQRISRLMRGHQGVDKCQSVCEAQGGEEHFVLQLQPNNTNDERCHASLAI